MVADGRIFIVCEISKVEEGMYLCSKVAEALSAACIECDVETGLANIQVQKYIEGDHDHYGKGGRQ